MSGHRLQNLLRNLLPKHPQFKGIHKSIAAEHMRIVNHYIEQIALLIDQHEYSKVQAKDTICSGDSDDSGIVDNQRHFPETIQSTPTFCTIASPAASFDDESELSSIPPMQEDDGFISVQQSPPGSVNSSGVESLLCAHRATKPSSEVGESGPEKTASALKYTARKPSRKHVVSPDSEPRSNDFPSVLSQAYENVKQALPISLAQGDNATATINQNYTINGRTERRSPYSEEAASENECLNTELAANSAAPKISRVADCDPHPSADNIEVISYSGKHVIFEADRRVIDSASYLAGEQIASQVHSLADKDDFLKANVMPCSHRLTSREETFESTIMEHKEPQQQLSYSNPYTTRPALKSLGNNLQSSKKEQFSDVKSFYDDSRDMDTRTETPFLPPRSVKVAGPRTISEDDIEYDQKANSPRYSRTSVYCESQPDIHASPTTNEKDTRPHLEIYGRLRRKEISLEEPETRSPYPSVVTGDSPFAKVSCTRHSRELPERVKVAQRNSRENNSIAAAKGPRNHLNSTSQRRQAPQDDFPMSGLIWDSANKSTQWSHELELAATFPIFKISHREKQCQATELDEIIRSIVEDASPVTMRKEKSKNDSASTMNDKRFPSSPTFTHAGWSLPRSDIHGSLVKPRIEEPATRAAGRRNKSYDRMKGEPTRCSSFSFSSKPVHSSATSVNVDWGDLSLDKDSQGYLDSLDLLAIAPVNEVKDKITSREDPVTQESSRVLSSQRQCSPPFPWKQSRESYLNGPETDLQDRTSQKSVATMGSKKHGLSAKPKYVSPSANAFTSLVNTNHSLIEYEENRTDNNTPRNAVTTFKTVFSFCLTHR